jgi:signal transduction histidine kinase
VLELEVEDHGRGLPVDLTRSGPPSPGGVGVGGRGLGLVAMRERAELVHGSLEFSPPAGGGTLVRLKVPLSAEAEASALHHAPVVERRL